MTPLPNIDGLTIPQKLELIEKLWDSMPDSPTPDMIPDWHLEEVKRRQAELAANPGIAIPWEKVRERLRNRP